MSITYERIAGQNKERIAALSDGIFAIAMTLIVLEIRVPGHDAIQSEAGLRAALLDLAPRFLMYASSFLALGIFWFGQQTQLDHLARIDRRLSWVHLVFLAFVALLPFSTGLLAEFLAFRTALLVYWLNLLALGLALLLSWQCAVGSGLVKPDLPPATVSAIRRRIVVAQVTYALAAALCAVGTLWSLGAILLLQLWYGFAPAPRPFMRGA